MELDWLKETSFRNFHIPAIILFIFNGLGYTMAAALNLRKTVLPAFGIVYGEGMMIWIIGQVAFIGYKNFLQPLYFALAPIQFLLGIVILQNKQAEIYVKINIPN